MLGGRALTPLDEAAKLGAGSCMCTPRRLLHATNRRRLVNPQPLPSGIGNIGHYNDGSHNLGSRNVGSRNIGDYNLCALCIGHRLQGFSLAGPPAILPNGTDTHLKLEPTKEEL